MADNIFVALGDFLQIAIPCIGFAVSFLHGDREGTKQILYAVLLMAFLVQGIKFITHDMPIGIRPHGGKGSFPSGHTASSFQGALFLWKRRGWKWGILVIGLAGLTAYSRIYGHYHHWRDVIVGVFIAFLVNKWLVTPPKINDSSFS
ncbi:MAG: phosphatase PAP2 family protein [Puniceicoccales bacterium]|nr:phosphatase PAP2 family protein [Puniceicoccales bacterium]